MREPTPKHAQEQINIKIDSTQNSAFVGADKVGNSIHNSQNE
jgi:hypothetical protein